jgi:hypothetical protein
MQIEQGPVLIGAYNVEKGFGYAIMEGKDIVGSNAEVQKRLGLGHPGRGTCVVREMLLHNSRRLVGGLYSDGSLDACGKVHAVKKELSPRT